MNRRKLLIVDDAPDVREYLLQALSSGYDIIETSSHTTARQILDEGRVDCLIVDVAATDLEGETLIHAAANRPTGPATIAIKERGTEASVRVIQLGAYDFIEKPFTVDRLIHTIERAVEHNSLRQQNSLLVSRLRTHDPVSPLIGQTEVAVDLREKVRALANSSTPFLVSGERGSGKKLFVSEVHRLSARTNAPLVRVRCSAVPEAVLMNELFGEDRAESGTGQTTMSGRIELADGGILLLEDVGHLPQRVADKIADVIDRGSIQRVGGCGNVAVDVRVAATTTRDLASEAERGQFSDSLFGLLNVVAIKVPPLRDRQDDIPRLVEFFVDELAMRSKRAVSISEDALTALSAGYWGGNIRELRNAVERAHIFATGGRIGLAQLQVNGTRGRRANPMEQTFHQGSIRDMEKLMIVERLDANNQNRTRAARTLEISVRTLRNKLREYREAGSPALAGVGSSLPGLTTLDSLADKA